MTESLFWSEDVSKLKNFGVVKRIEDLLDKGTADVVYCTHFDQNERARTGWIELKRLRSWPARPDTLVRLPHYTPHQANFLVRWGRAGAGAFLLARVGNDYLLWPWQSAKAIQAGLPKAKLTALAVAVGRGIFPLRDVLREVSRWPDNRANGLAVGTLTPPAGRPMSRGKPIK
jgi:hypothetical protein